MPRSRRRPAALDLGSRYGYRRELGRGGAGRVFLVHDRRLGTEVALKLLRDPFSSRDERARFQREFELLAKIEHPGIARALDFGYLGRRPYFTSEFIPGEPIGRQGGLEPGDLLARAVEIVEAAAFLHRQGLLHLDIKPGNVLLRQVAAGRRAVLIDFGLFRTSASLPVEGPLRGSLPYMAPEYFLGKLLGPWTDVYAIGATLYRLATGVVPRPDTGGTPGRLGRIESWTTPPLPPSAISPVVSAELENLILKCLAIDAEARFADAGALLGALQRIGGGPSADGDGRTAPLHTVGRNAELARIDRFLAVLAGAARSGDSAARPAALLVTGPPGAGMSHLLRELKVRAQTCGLSCYLEVGYPGRTAAPGSLLRGLVSHVRGKSSEAGARWAGFVDRLGRRRKGRRAEGAAAEREQRLRGELALYVQSLEEPLVLAVDGLQHWDEVSIELVLALVRVLGEEGPTKRPLLALVLGYREEGTAVELLREITLHLTRAGKGEVIALQGLAPEDCLELRRGLNPGSVAASSLSIFQETRGLPARILAREAAGPGKDHAPDRGGERPAGCTPASAGAREVLVVLALLARPAAGAELARASGFPPRRTERLLRDLERDGAVIRLDADGSGTWLAGPEGDRVLATLGAAPRRAIHRRIGAALAREARSREDALVEAARHFQLAGSRSDVLAYGLQAAWYLKETHQLRAALEWFRHVLAAAGAGRSRLRLEAALEVAGLHGRLGSLDDGIRILQDFLRRGRALTRTDRARVLLQLATLHGRRGDFRRADTLFTEGLRPLRTAARGRRRDDFLFFLNENAAMKAFLGRHQEALDLCRQGLQLAGKRKDPGARELALNFHAVRANVALRTFDYAAAAREFETALEIAESIGSEVNRAVVLNNLAIVHANRDRHAEAIEAFREAEQASLRLEEGPSLVAIHSNLAVLHAKLGAWEEMERSLAAAARLSPANMGRRQQLSLEHAAGMGLLLRGRFGDSLPRFAGSIRLAEAVGDDLMAAFDKLHRAEAQVFTGAYEEAAQALLAIAGTTAGRVGRSARARLAFLGALTGQSQVIERALDDPARTDTGPAVPYLDAMDTVFLAWAFLTASAGGETLPAGWRSVSFDEMDHRLEKALAYFRGHGLKPAASLAAWVRAEGHFLHGRDGEALAILEQEPAAGSEFTAVVQPLLLARILLGRGDQEAARAADLLASAGGALAGNPLPEWELRLASLRAAMQPAAPEAEAALEARRAGLARQLPPDARRRYLESHPWRRWTAGFERSPGRETARRAKRGGTAPRSSRTVAIASSRDGAGSILVARSKSMRRLLATLERIRAADLPVLIEGETGTGKELVARTIHEESSRAGKPFVVVDCATLPPELVEAELFGARQGAFTGSDADRAGILAGAGGGTVLLDEIAAVPLAVQGKLLRLLAEGTFRRLGDEGVTRLEARFLFSTAKDLEAEARARRFREDLLHRLRVLRVRVPPLRERSEDVAGLLALFLGEGGEPPAVEAGVGERLAGRSWPGNVRELRNFVARLRVENPERITADSVECLLRDPETSTVFPGNVLCGGKIEDLKDQLERDYLRFHFHRLGGDTSALLRFLKVSRAKLYRRCGELGIRLREERKRLD